MLPETGAQEADTGQSQLSHSSIRPNVAKKTRCALYRQEVVECSRRRKGNRMGQISEPEAVDEPSPTSDTSSEERLPPIPNASQSLPTHLARPQRRWKRTWGWKVWLVSTLLGIVVIASLLGRFFLVNSHTGALAPTPTSLLGITVSPGSVPTYTTKSLEGQRLDQALNTYIRQMSLDDELGQMIQVQFVSPGAGGSGGGHQLTIPADWQA